MCGAEYGMYLHCLRAAGHRGEHWSDDPDEGEDPDLYPDMEGPIGTGVRAFHVGAGFEVSKMSEELSQYVDILLGRVDPPIDAGVLTLMELAEAFHARAKEMEMEIHEAERTGAVLKNSGAYRFRTGKLRSFTELASKTIELGSRRVTHAQYLLREREGR